MRRVQAKIWRVGLTGAGEVLGRSLCAGRPLIEDESSWRAGEARGRLGASPDDRGEEVLERGRCIGVGEVELDHHVSVVVDWAVNALPEYSCAAARLGESRERGRPGCEVGDGVLDMKGGHASHGTRLRSARKSQVVGVLLLC